MHKIHSVALNPLLNNGWSQQTVMRELKKIMHKIHSVALDPVLLNNGWFEKL